jgi:hypothetical protein
MSLACILGNQQYFISNMENANFSKILANHPGTTHHHHHHKKKRDYRQTAVKGSHVPHSFTL